MRQIWSGLATQTPSGVSGSSTSIFAPAGTPAHSIFGLSMLVLGITGAIFLVVGGLLFYVLLRYRHRAGDAAIGQSIRGDDLIVPHAWAALKYPVVL